MFTSNVEVKQNRKLNWAKVDTKALANFLNSEQAQEFQLWNFAISSRSQNTDTTLTLYTELCHALKEKF